MGTWGHDYSVGVCVMETQHRVFVVTGDGSNTFFVHVWVADVSVWIKMCGWRLLPQPDLRLPSRTSAWWKGTSTLCWGAGSERRRRDPFLEIGQGKDAAMVEWSVGMVTLNITVTLPRMTWVAICDWVATVLSDDEQANLYKPPHIIDPFDFIRPSRGDEFLASQDWPMRATAPTLEEVEAGHCGRMASDDNNWKRLG